MARKAQIRSSNPHSPFSLRVIQTDGGEVYWDLVDRDHETRRLIVATTPQAARTLAQWVLDNVKVEKGKK